MEAKKDAEEEDQGLDHEADPVEITEEVEEVTREAAAEDHTELNTQLLLTIYHHDAIGLN